MKQSTQPNEKTYLIFNQREGIERSFELLVDLDLDPLRTHWEPSYRLWVVFQSAHDAVHFRLKFAGEPLEVIDGRDSGAEVVLIVSCDLKSDVADWFEECHAQDRSMWAEEVWIRFENADAQRDFRSGLSRGGVDSC